MTTCFVCGPSPGITSIPGRPEVVSAGDDHITLTWEPPISDGGCEILHYVLEKREVRGPRWVHVHKSIVQCPPYTVRNMMYDGTYEFRVFAQNVMGLSDPSEMSKPITCKQNGITISCMLTQCWREGSNCIELEPCGVCKQNLTGKIIIRG